MKKEGRIKIRYIGKEKGLLGEEALAWWLLAIATFFLLFAMHHYIVVAGWTGVVTEMQPSHLYPPLLDNGYPWAEIEVGHGGRSLLHGAIWIQQNIVMRYFVNTLFIIILLLVGVAYLYHDLFEQFLNTRLRTFLPRIVFGLILAYTNIYIIEALMTLAKGGYVLLYNAPGPFKSWQRPDFLEWIIPEYAHAGTWWGGVLDWLAKGYLGFIWVFVVQLEVLSILLMVTIRDFLLAVILVLLPIASLLLIHPWTQRIGSRLWWLAIDLVFLPIVMIIPLMLLGLVRNSVSFTIAGLTIVIGSLYLIALEPFVLTGAGFSRAGTVLAGGLAGGQLGGSMFTAQERLGGGFQAGAQRLREVGVERFAEWRKARKESRMRVPLNNLSQVVKEGGK